VSCLNLFAEFVSGKIKVSQFKLVKKSDTFK